MRIERLHGHIAAAFVLLTLASRPLVSQADPAFAIVPDRPVTAMVALPSPQHVVALHYGEVREKTTRMVSDWLPSAAGLLVFERLTGEMEPLFFRAVYASGEELLIGHRALPGVTGRNLRDLGGYVTTDGRRVKPGLLYRSGRLDNLNEGEQQLLAALGIRRLCDFRTRAEIEEHANPELGASLVEHCQDSSTADLTGALEALLAQERQGKSVDWVEVMQHSYRGMGSRYAAQFRAMFDALKSEDALPMLFRCSAGKDRTGVAAALLLSILGVPEETVVADYRLSELYPVAAFGSEVFPSELIKLPALKATHPEYIRAALDGIRAEYGSLDRYVHEVLGFSERDIIKLRERVLEVAPFQR